MARSTRIRSQTSGITAGLFFVVLVVGVSAIVFLKLTGAHQGVVTAVPVIIMFVYAGVILAFRRLRLRLDQAGDNLYYLGFLYTLSSLAISLIEFGNNDKAASLIITNFGVAIATTITGLALRVLFSQMRSDPIETEQLARVELAEASRHLRVELDNSAREFSLFQKSLQQMIAESFQELQQTLDQTMHGNLSRFETGIEQFVGAVADANQGFEGRSDALRDSADKLVGNISNLAERIEAVQVSEEILLQQVLPAIDMIDKSALQLGSTVENLSERIESIEISDDVFIKQLQPAINKFTEAAEISRQVTSADHVRAEAWAELAGEVKQMVDGIQDSLKGAQNSSVMYVEGAKSIQIAAEQMSAFSNHMDAVVSKMGTIAETTDMEFKRVVEGVVNNLEGLSHQLAAQASRISSSAPQQREIIVETAPVAAPANPEPSGQVPTEKKGGDRGWFRFGRSSRPEN
jgi:hypothetical protein